MSSVFGGGGVGGETARVEEREQPEAEATRDE